MDELQELYQQVIIDHGTKPRNSGKLNTCSHQAEGFNPLCGDELMLYLDVDDNNIIQDVKFESEGCAISTASASLMSQFLKGKSVAEANDSMHEFTDMVTNSPKADHHSLGKLTILAGVNKYPSRVKCASLAWHTLLAALNKQTDAVSTE
jgi:nitrogen fixation NifU-like protein